MQYTDGARLAAVFELHCYNWGLEVENGFYLMASACITAMGGRLLGSEVSIRKPPLQLAGMHACRRGPTVA